MNWQCPRPSYIPIFRGMRISYIPIVGLGHILLYAQQRDEHPKTKLVVVLFHVTTMRISGRCRRSKAQDEEYRARTSL